MPCHVIRMSCHVMSCHRACAHLCPGSPWKSAAKRSMTEATWVPPMPWNCLQTCCRAHEPKRHQSRHSRSTACEQITKTDFHGGDFKRHKTFVETNVLEFSKLFVTRSTSVEECHGCPLASNIYLSSNTTGHKFCACDRTFVFGQSTDHRVPT